MGRYLQLTVGEPSAGSALGHNSCFPLVHMFILIFIQHMFIPILQQGRMMLTFVCCRVCVCVCVRWTLAAVCVCVCQARACSGCCRNAAWFRVQVTTMALTGEHR